ncbi:uncharacterized protein LOC120326351 [Styela clava]
MLLYSIMFAMSLIQINASQETQFPKQSKCFAPVYCLNSGGKSQLSWKQIFSADSQLQCSTSNTKGEKGKLGLKGEKGDKGLPGNRGIIGPTGKLGVPGSKGETGIQGPAGVKGSTGDHGRKGDPGLKGINGNRGSGGDAFGSFREIMTDIITRSDNNQSYEGNIFIPLMSEKVLRKAAIKKCKDIGGELANIYNDEHMDRIASYIRNNKIEASLNYFHLGMTYKDTNNRVSLRNGTLIPGNEFKWRPGCPYGGYKYPFSKNVYLLVHSDALSLYQYFCNFNDLDVFVLCEIQRR